MIFSRCAVALALAWFCGSAAATDNILVTATRYPILEDRALIPVNVIGPEEIERSAASDLTDLLRMQPGIDAVRAGGPGQQTSLFLHGTESNHVLVLVDGVRINAGSVGIAAVGSISPDLVERIEIVKAPRTSLYGEDAIGGVINVITRRPQDGQLSASGGTGTFGRRELDLAGGRTIGGLDISLMAHRTRYDDVPVLEGPFPDLEHELTTLNGRIGRKVSDWDVEGRFWQATGTTGYFSQQCNADYSVCADVPLDQDSINRVTALRLDRRFGPRLSTRVDTGVSVDDVDQNQGDDFVRSERWHLDWQNDLLLGGDRRMIAGAYLSREDVSAVSLGSALQADDTDVAAAYVEYAGTYGRHGTTLAARYSDHDAFGAHWTWNAEYGLDLGPSLRLVSSAGHAVRAPGVYDRFGPFGNQGLDPEESLSLQAGARWRTGEASLFSFSLFRTRIDDLIDFDFAVNRLRNLARARIHGGEASWERSGDTWRWRVSGLIQDPEDAATGAPLLRRAERTFSTTLTRTAGTLTTGLEFLAVASREDFAGPLPGYGIASLTALWQVTGRVAVRARMDNVFDRDYVPAWYNFGQPYAAAGRSIYGEVAWQVR